MNFLLLAKVTQRILDVALEAKVRDPVVLWLFSLFVFLGLGGPLAELSLSLLGVFERGLDIFVDSEVGHRVVTRDLFPFFDFSDTSRRGLAPDGGAGRDRLDLGHILNFDIFLVAGILPLTVGGFLVLQVLVRVLDVFFKRQICGVFHWILLLLLC